MGSSNHLLICFADREASGEVVRGCPEFVGFLVFARGLRIPNCLGYVTFPPTGGIGKGKDVVPGKEQSSAFSCLVGPRAVEDVRVCDDQVSRV